MDNLRQSIFLNTLIQQLAHVIPAFPTMSEVYLDLIDALVKGIENLWPHLKEKANEVTPDLFDEGSPKNRKLDIFKEVLSEIWDVIENWII